MKKFLSVFVTISVVCSLGSTSTKTIAMSKFNSRTLITTAAKSDKTSVHDGGTYGPVIGYYTPSTGSFELNSYGRSIASNVGNLQVFEKTVANKLATKQLTNGRYSINFTLMTKAWNKDVIYMPYSKDNSILK